MKSSLPEAFLLHPLEDVRQGNIRMKFRKVVVGVFIFSSSSYVVWDGSTVLKYDF